MRYRLSGLILLAADILLVLYAAGDDGYYGDGTSRWEHTTGYGGQPLVIAMFIVLAVITVALLVAPRLLRNRVLLAGVLGLYVAAWLLGYGFLSIGH